MIQADILALSYLNKWTQYMLNIIIKILLIYE